MPKHTLERQFLAVLQASPKTLSPSQVITAFYKALLKYLKANKAYDMGNKAKPWSDAELQSILSDAPTPQNQIKHALTFKRGVLAIQEIYRWASRSRSQIKIADRNTNSFVQQIKRAHRTLGRIA